MKKLLLSLLVVFSLTTAVNAQRVQIESAMNNNRWMWGLRDSNSGKWVVQPQFQSIEQIRGGYFWVRTYEWKFGVYDSYGKIRIPIKYQDIDVLKDGEYTPLYLFAVKLNDRWGIVTLDNEVIVDFEFDKIKNVPSGVRFEWHNGNEDKYAVYNPKEMLRLKDQVIAKKAEAERARKQAEAESAARKKKEAELASFTKYAKLYVEPKIDKWQKKDEFETTAEYRLRVTGYNRSQMIDKFTAEARDLFLKEHAKLNENAKVTLGAYDADNEVFLVTSPIFGEMLISVPRNEAPTLKQNFDKYSVVNKKYFVNNDKIGLMEFTLRSSDGKKSYKYNNNDALKYNTYDVDLAVFDFAPIDIPKTATAAAQNVGSVKVQVDNKPKVKPTLRIISPANGSNYTTSDVVVRYEATTGDGTPPNIEIWVNGKPYVEKADVNAASKGVKRASNEMILSLPQEVGECYVTMQVVDSQGDIKQERLVLNYTGAKPKPVLHIFAVGVSNYNQPALRLNQAAKDAIDFVDVLKKSNTSQYERLANPIVLTDKTATEKEIKRSLRQLENTTNQEDVVMIFFSGHGEKEGNETYFLPVDAEKEDLLATAVDFDIIRKAVQRLVDKKCRVVVFMDACYSGTLGSKGANDDLTLAAPGVVGFYSSTANQQSKESKEWNNGIFTKVLLEGLKGGAVNADGEITIYKLQSYISDGVKRATGGKQSPIINNEQGDMVLLRK